MEGQRKGMDTLQPGNGKDYNNSSCYILRTLPKGHVLFYGHGFMKSSQLPRAVDAV